MRWACRLLVKQKLKPTSYFNYPKIVIKKGFMDCWALIVQAKWGLVISYNS